MQRLILPVLPGGLITGAVILFLAASFAAPLRSQLTPSTLDLISLCIVAVAASLAVRFDRARVLLALTILFLGELAERSSPLEMKSSLALGYAILILATALIAERGIRSLKGILLLAVPVLVTGGIHLNAKSATELLAPLLHLQFLGSGISYPHISILIATLALLIQAIRYLRQPGPVEAGLLWSFAATLGAAFFTTGMTATLIRGIAPLSLVIALIETSHTLAFRDELTGLPGRRALMECFKRLGRRYVIAMVDIDFFKKLNDTYGHDVGDQVLRMVAQRLKGVTGGGMAFRYGGEEFCIVFRGKGRAESKAHLETLRLAIADQPFIVREKNRPENKPKNPQGGGTTSLDVTVSIGYAERSKIYADPESVMKAADQSLYRAKEGGRNKVCP